MELELGLALPNQKGFDLNIQLFDREEIGRCLEVEKQEITKRGFAEVYQHNAVSDQTMPLLLWNGQPNGEDDDHGRRKRRNCNSRNIEEEKVVMGWPPVKSWRKKLLDVHQGGGGRLRNSINKFVKVRMEGVAIGRKIDIRLHHSYQSLTTTLINMFLKYQRDEGHDGDYSLLYQDRQGDWMLAGDVPWQTFMESVQRIEMIKKTG